MIYPNVSFEECFNEKDVVEIRDTRIYVASVKNLLKSKRFLHRGKDIADIEILETMLEEEK